MKKALFLLIMVLLTSQLELCCQTDWQWAYQGANNDGYGFIRVDDIDRHNNVYAIFPYGNSIVFKDTMFYHEGFFYNNANFAIVKHDANGNFIKAIDVFSPSNAMLSYHARLLVDNDFNIYLALEIQDTVLINEYVFVPETSYGDVILLKFNSQFELLWEQQVYGPISDNEVRGIYLADDNNVFLEVLHKGNPYVFKSVNFFDQDTAEYKTEMISVMKIGPSGNLLWRKEIRSTELEYIFAIHSTVGENGAYYCLGSAEYPIIVDGDTVFPSNDTLPAFYYDVAFKSNGQVLHSIVNYLYIQYYEKSVSSNGDYFFSAYISETVVFGDDTIVYDPELPTLLIGRMDTLYNPVWYEKLTGPLNYTFRFKLDLKDDMLFFSTDCRNSFEFADSIYDVGTKQSVLYGMFTADGELIYTKIAQGSNSVFGTDVKLDYCSNAILSGSFKGELIAGSDTLIQNDLSREDNFIAKITDLGLSKIDLGPDTTIAVSESFDLLIPDYFSNILWSTGETTNSITVSGNDLQDGINHIWVDAFQGDCFATDTILIFVIDNSGISENENNEIYFYPNPTANTLNFYSELGLNLFNVKVFNQFGVLVLQQGLLSDKIDLINLQNGIYIIEFEYKQKVTRQKIIVRK
ncbi:MAG: T9SS type A sorting domain-containing protein [Bacteroidales bacterium]|nr:T9SS type A sorting domain-containing protein [Bacteroidales bacterium]